MPAAVREQLTVCGSLSDLERFIATEAIPKEYGGQSPFDLGEAEEETGLLRLVEACNARAGVSTTAASGGGSSG